MHALEITDVPQEFDINGDVQACRLLLRFQQIPNVEGYELAGIQLRKEKESFALRIFTERKNPAVRVGLFAPTASWTLRRVWT